MNHWRIEDKHIPGRYLDRNGGWTTYKHIAQRFNDLEKKAGEDLSHVPGGYWVYVGVNPPAPAADPPSTPSSGVTTVEDLIFSLEIARSNIEVVANAMTVLGMDNSSDTLAEACKRLDDVMRLVKELDE